MPWKDKTVFEERLQFIRACLAGERNMSALCAAYGISRKTGYKWLHSYRAGGDYDEAVGSGEVGSGEVAAE